MSIKWAMNYQLNNRGATLKVHEFLTEEVFGIFYKSNHHHTEGCPETPRHVQTFPGLLAPRVLHMLMHPYSYTPLSKRVTPGVPWTVDNPWNVLGPGLYSYTPLSKHPRSTRDCGQSLECLRTRSILIHPPVQASQEYQGLWTIPGMS